MLRALAFGLLLIYGLRGFRKVIKSGKTGCNHIATLFRALLYMGHVRR